MVSVTADHASEKVGVFLVYAGQAVLLDHEDSHTVTCVKQLGSHRIVARTVGVASELLKLHEPPFLKAVRDSAADSGMVLMHVHSLQLHGFSIEHEPGVRVEGYVSYTCCRLVRISQHVVAVDLCHHIVKIWILVAPEVRS